MITEKSVQYAQKLIQLINSSNMQTKPDSLIDELVGAVDLSDSGTTEEILMLWSKSDKEGRSLIEHIFYLLTDITFQKFLSLLEEKLGNMLDDYHMSKRVGET